MILKIGFVFFILVGFTFSSIGQIPKEQIKKELSSMNNIHQQCLDKGDDMLGCATVFYNQMDSMLNVVYRQFRAQLDTVKFKQLKKEQLQWLADRNKNFKQLDKEAGSNELGSDVGHIYSENQKAAFIYDRIIFLLEKW